MAGFLFSSFPQIFIRLRLEHRLFVSFVSLKNDHFSGSLHDFNQRFIILFCQFKLFSAIDFRFATFQLLVSAH